MSILYISVINVFQFKANICSTQPCLNEGQCDSIDGINYSCECKTGYEGEDCQHEIVKANSYNNNPCFSMPCFNSGKCRAINSKFRCECEPGFYGTYCEADLRRCTSSPCAKDCQCIEIPQNMSHECICSKKSHDDTFKLSTKVRGIFEKIFELFLFFDEIIFNKIFSIGHISTLMYRKNDQSSPFSSLPNYSRVQGSSKFANDDEKKVFGKKMFSISLKTTDEDEQISSASRELSPPSKSNVKQLLSGNEAIRKKPCVDFNPCKHGQCLLSNKTGEFMCQCNVGYMGPFCDLMRHPCDFKPCENGICEIVGDLYYKCLCKPNYTGVNCHIGKIKTQILITTTKNRV